MLLLGEVVRNERGTCGTDEAIDPPRLKVYARMRFWRPSASAYETRVFSCTLSLKIERGSDFSLHEVSISEGRGIIDIKSKKMMS